MQSKPIFELGEWKGQSNALWETQSYCFASEINILEVCNGFIQKHGSRLDISSRLVDSYRSYLIQTIKDIDYYLANLNSGTYGIADFTNFIVDVSLTKAQPWRFTAYALRFIASKLSSYKVDELDGHTLWSLIHPLLDEAFENGSLYRIEKYIKVGHVIMDVAYDVGWCSIYSKASQLKGVEGLSGNPERSSTLRELSLFYSRNFWQRGYVDAAKQILCIGFPDIPHVMSSLDDEDIERLLLKVNSNEAIQILFNDQMAKSTKNVSCNQVVEGALRVIGLERST